MTSLSPPSKIIKPEPEYEDKIDIEEEEENLANESEEEELYVDASSDTDLEVSDTEENLNPLSTNNNSEDLETRVATLSSLVKQVRNSKISIFN